MAVFVECDGNMKLISANDPRRWMQQIEVTDLLFRVKRTLNRQWTMMTRRGEHRFVPGAGKMQIQFGLPAPCECLVRNRVQSVSLISMRVFAYKKVCLSASGKGSYEKLMEKGATIRRPNEVYSNTRGIQSRPVITSSTRKIRPKIAPSRQ